MKDYQNEIYAAIIAHCEGLEHQGIYSGNGHHLAQRLTAMVQQALEKAEKKEEARLNK